MSAAWWNNLPPSTRLSSHKKEWLLCELDTHNIRVFTIPGVRSKVDFFAHVKTELPLDPQLGGAPNWDAFEDSFFEGLCNLSENDIALVWIDAHELLNSDPEQFAVASSVLSDVARELSDPKYSKKVAVFLLGEGPHFDSRVE